MTDRLASVSDNGRVANRAVPSIDSNDSSEAEENRAKQLHSGERAKERDLIQLSLPVEVCERKSVRSN